MKILQYIGSSLINTVGGAERVFCQMASTFAARGHEVYAVCNDPRSGHPFYPLDDRVHFVNLDGSQRRRRFKPMTWITGLRPFLPAICKDMWDQYIELPFFQTKGELLVKLIRDIQPDVLILFWIEDYFSILQQQMPDTPVIVTHRTNVERFVFRINSRLKTAKINTLSHLHVLQRSFIPEIQKIYHGRIHAIPNTAPQIEEGNQADLTVEKPQKTVLMVSRLDRGKQQHLLIQAFRQLAEDYPDWNVEVYGPPSKQKYLQQLQKMIVSLDLVGRVELMGTTNHPLEILCNADIFAFPSNFPEGFSNALAEAMSVGLPCIGLKSTPSVNELIVDGVNGFLADNTPEDFARKLKILMDDQALRVKMGKAGHEMMKEYAPEKIYDQWENLLFEVVNSSRSIPIPRPTTTNTPTKKAA